MNKMWYWFVRWEQEKSTKMELNRNGTGMGATNMTATKMTAIHMRAMQIENNCSYNVSSTLKMQNDIHVAYIYTFFISVIVVGVIGNALVVLGFSSKRKLLRLAVNVFIYHLAIVNLVTVVSVTPLFLAPSTELGRAAQRFRDVSYPVSIAIAQQTLSVIAATRWMTVGTTAVKKAHQLMCSGRGICVVLGLMWTIVLTITVPVWLDFDDCNHDKNRNKVTFYVIFNILPAFVLVPVFNIMTLRIVQRSRKRVRNRQEDGKVPTSQQLKNVASVSFLVGPTDASTARVQEAKIDSKTSLHENHSHSPSSLMPAAPSFAHSSFRT